MIAFESCIHFFLHSFLKQCHVDLHVDPNRRAGENQKGTRVPHAVGPNVHHAGIPGVPHRYDVRDWYIAVEMMTI